MTDKIGEMRAQLDTLAAPTYTLYLRNGVSKACLPIRMKTSEYLLNHHSLWGEKNLAGDDVYIVPDSNNCFFVVIDDVKNLQDIYQYGPCYIQETSAANYQAVIKVVGPVVRHDSFWRAVTAVVRILNRRHGDPNVSSPRQAFRVPGFLNLKPGRNRFCVTSLFCEPDQLASDLVLSLVWREREKIEAADAKKRLTQSSVQQSSVQSSCSSDDIVANVRAAALFFEKEKKRILGLCRFRGWAVDMSRVDYQIMQAMKKAGFSRDLIFEVFNSCSDVASRHSDPNGYLSLTLSKIF